MGRFKIVPRFHRNTNLVIRNSLPARSVARDSILSVEDRMDFSEWRGCDSIEQCVQPRQSLGLEPMLRLQLKPLAKMG